MNVAASIERPAVAVRYRDRWFYVNDRGLDAKSTFSLVGQLFLHTADSANVVPLLTFPLEH